MNPQTKNTMESFNALLAHGDIVQCPSCWQYSAYAWQDVNMSSVGVRLIPEDGFADGGELYTEDEYLPAWPDVYHIPASSGFEWTCGMCKSSFCEEDSPINHPCYTHRED